MKIILCLLALSALLSAQIIPLHKHIINEIFQEHTSYLIYVHGDNHNFQVEAVFNSYCFGDKNCAVLQPNIENYEQIRQFIGQNKDEYFLIIDPINKFKYVLQLVNNSITSQDLLSFQYKVLHHQIDPFFASEALPDSQNIHCSQLVGKNLGEFVRRQERLKVILLYSLNEHCQACDQILQQFILFSEKNYREGLVTFGYFNVFLNDHPIVRDEKTPYFLMFLDEEYQVPFEMPAEDFQALEKFISSTLYPQTRKSVSEPNEVYKADDDESEL